MRSTITAQTFVNVNDSHHVHHHHQQQQQQHSVAAAALTVLTVQL